MEKCTTIYIYYNNKIYSQKAILSIAKFQSFIKNLTAIGI